jgi:plasmid stabilization system protein ParE
VSTTFLQLPKAQKEILDAWEWYEERRIGLGDLFKDEVAKKIRDVVENPLHYQLKGRYREAQTDVFPYLIVFRFDKKADIIFIVSVFHMKRNPKKKR